MNILEHGLSLLRVQNLVPPGPAAVSVSSRYDTAHPPGGVAVSLCHGVVTVVCGVLCVPDFCTEQSLHRLACLPACSLAMAASCCTGADTDGACGVVVDADGGCGVLMVLLFTLLYLVAGCPQ